MARRRYHGAVIALLLTLGLGCGSSAPAPETAGDPTPPDEASISLWSPGPWSHPWPRTAPRAEGVADALLALLVGLAEEPIYGRLNAVGLDSLVRGGGGSRLPYQRILEILRLPGRNGSPSSLILRFDGDVDEPVPYSLLGYRPGRVLASRELLLDQWNLGDVALDVAGSRGRRTLRVQALRLFGLRRGSMEADVDGVVDALFGNQIDDMNFTGFALLGLRGKRYAVAFGYTLEGSGRSGAFDLEEDVLVFPVPRHFLGLGRELRTRLERLQRRDGMLPIETPRAAS